MTEAYQDSQISYISLEQSEQNIHIVPELENTRSMIEHLGEIATSVPLKRKSAPRKTYFDPVKQYLNDISRYDLLNKADEVELAQTIERGCAASDYLADKAEFLDDSEIEQYKSLSVDGLRAKQEFITANLRLVVSIAKRFSKQADKLNLLDLIQHGNLGLEHAVDKFEWRKGFKFSTYSTWWIKQAVSRGIINEGSTIRLTTQEYAKLTRFTRISGHEKSDEELMESEGWSKHDLNIIRNNFKLQPKSLDKVYVVDSDTTLADMTADPNGLIDYETVENKIYVQGLIDALEEILSPEEFEVLKLRNNFIEDISTFDQIAKKLGSTREKIRKIESSVMAKLKHPTTYKDFELKFQPESSNETSWKQNAECSDISPDDFFMKEKNYFKALEINEVVDRIELCGRCAVSESCLDFANNKNIKHGWWGGKSFGVSNEYPVKRKTD